MSDLETKIRTVGLKTVGPHTAEADIAFVNRGDRDREAFGPDAIEDGVTVGVYRNHDGVRHGDRPPFAIATVHKRPGDRWSAAIKFLPTPRGEEEHTTAKAFYDAGVEQDVSVGMLVLQTGPVPEDLRPNVDRYLTRVKLLELSLVTIGAVPHAQLTAVKNRATAPAPDASLAGEAARFAATVERHAMPAGVQLPERFAPVVKFAQRRFCLEEKDRPGIIVVAPGALPDGASGQYLPEQNLILVAAGIPDRETEGVLLHEHAHAYERAKHWSHDERFACGQEAKLLAQWNATHGSD